MVRMLTMDNKKQSIQTSDEVSRTVQEMKSINLNCKQVIK